jgi:PAS domain S-box-containing protein
MTYLRQKPTLLHPQSSMASTQLHLFAGDGQVRALLRERDWSHFPLGKPETWPIPFQTALQLTLDSTQPACLSWGKELFLFYNDAYTAILGEKHPQALCKPIWEVWAEVKDTFGREIDEALGGRSIFQRNVRFRILRKEQLEDGWFTYSVLPLRDEQGNVAGIFNSTMETTIKVEAEKRADFLLELADRLRPLTIADDITAAANEWLGSYLKVARVFYAEVNDAASSFIIRHDWSRSRLSSVAGEVRAIDAFGAEAMSVLRSGQPLVIDDVTLDPRTSDYLAAYDQVGVRAFLAIPFMRAGQLSVVLNLHQTEPYHWKSSDIQLAYDVTERTWAAAESARAYDVLRYERDQSQYIFDSMVEGFTLLSDDWTIVRMNAAGLKITQREAQDVVGRNHWEVWPELKSTQLEQIYREVRQTKKAQIFEIPYTFPNGKDGWIEGRAQSTFDNGLALFFRDITDRRNAEDTLKDANRRKDEFLAMLAHELRNPLAPISSAAQLIKLPGADSKRIGHAGDIIVRQVKHMATIVDDLLDVSRVTRGLVKIEQASLDLKSVVSSAIEQAQPLIQARRHELLLKITPQRTVVRGDRTRLIQAVSNVLNNAVKYTPPNGRIALGLDVMDGQTRISIADNGMGMEPALLPLVFDMFTQAERTPDRAQGGLGLGLALVKSIVDLHGGSILAASEGEGKGSTFTITLPLLAAQDESQGCVQTPGPEQIGVGLRILIVDDNQDAGALLGYILEAAGHVIHVHEDAASALQAAQEFDFDIFILDIGLPDMDGYQLAGRLRSDARTAGATLIALTGYGQPQDRELSNAAGFDHHLVKPADHEELLRILSREVPRVL